MTPSDVADLLAHLTAAYPTAKAEPDTALVWVQHLERFDVDDARAGVHRWIDREKWMPSIAEMVTACRVEALASRELDKVNPRALAPVTYACRCAEGKGWIFTDTNTVKPCPDCRHEMHDLWVGGHLVSGHRCHDCHDRSAA